MGYHQIVRDLPRTGGVRFSGRQIFNIDTSQQPNPAIVGALAGFRYYLPPLNILWPVRQIIAYTAEQLTFNVDSGFGTMSVPTANRLVNYMITLVEPDGTHIVNNMPISCFNIGAANVVPHYFSLKKLIDPRQSYVVPLVDGGTHNLVFEFLYK